MKQFMDSDFLLSTDTAKWLYHTAAEPLPILDYHCHIDPWEIYSDRTFENLTQLWLGGDHYKWRVMRANGTPEELVTGAGSDRDKFRAFAAVMPRLIGNPLYHWSHMELQRYFGITKPLSPITADEIYDAANEKLKNWSARKFMLGSHVKVACTTDDPADDLRWHKLIAADQTMPVKVLPTFRPDKAINIEKPGFNSYIQKLEKSSGYSIKTAEDVILALKNRIDYFAVCGCQGADHGMDYCMYAQPNPIAADRAFQMAMSGQRPDTGDAEAFKTLVTVACAKMYADLGWVMQLHFGCLRDNNKPRYRTLGPDTGFDAVNSQSGVENLSPLLNAFAENNGLPKMVLYSLSPTDNTAIISIMQCFQESGVAGKLQHGSAWWFNDNRPGMRRQLEDLAANGVFGNFVGMLTDSRSFLSYTRHEYFRRVLCEQIGEWVESGQYPSDAAGLCGLVSDICYHNANTFFNFNI